MQARSKLPFDAGALEAGFGLPVRLVAPGPGPVAVWMHRGLDATTFHCLAGEQTLFVKQYAPDDISPAAFAATNKASARAAELGLSAKLLFADDGARLLAFEDMSKTHVASLRPWFDDRANVRAAKALLRRWHAAGVASRDCDWIATLDDHRARIEDAAKVAAAPEAALPASWERIVDLVGTLTARLGEPVSTPRPLHGEVMMSNLLRPISGGDMLLCDFDHSVNGDPLRDMAALWLEVSGYQGDTKDFATDLLGGSDRLLLWAIAEDLGWGFRAWAAHFDGRDPEVEYFKYARFRLNRALMNAVRTGLLPQPEAPAW